MNVEPPTHTDTTPDTQRAAYRSIRDTAEDVTLRKRVAAQIAIEPASTAELSKVFPERSANAIRPRVNELLRRGCVVRRDKTTNPSGHEAYRHHITDLGRQYLRGEVDPEPSPTLSELQRNVVDAARTVVATNTDKRALRTAIAEHDAAKQRRDPEWSPPNRLLTADERERVKERQRLIMENWAAHTADADADADADAVDTAETPDTQRESTDGGQSLTDAQLAKIDADPFLEPSDFSEIDT